MGQFLAMLEEPYPGPVPRATTTKKDSSAFFEDLENPLTLADQLLLIRKNSRLVKENSANQPQLPNSITEPSTESIRLDKLTRRVSRAVEHGDLAGNELKNSRRRTKSIKSRSHSLPRQDTFVKPTDSHSTHRTLKTSASDSGVISRVKAKVDSRPRKRTAKHTDDYKIFNAGAMSGKFRDHEKMQKYGIKPALAKEKALNEEARTHSRAKSRQDWSPLSRRAWREI